MAGGRTTAAAFTWILPAARKHTNEEPGSKLLDVFVWIGNLLYWPGPYPKPKTLKCNFWVVIFRSKLWGMAPNLQFSLTETSEKGNCETPSRAKGTTGLLYYARNDGRHVIACFKKNIHGLLALWLPP
jgi:hypothetical protein